MSFLFTNQVSLGVPLIDSAGRIRASNPLTLFEHNNQYGTNAFKWDTQTSGTGTITEPSTSNSTATTLSTGGTASGAAARRATRVYQRYQVGKSLFGGMSFVFGAGVTNCIKQVGFYDVNNGVYLQQNGATINIGIRTSASGSVVDTLVAQASWNVDPLNGAGPSGATFNPADINDFRVDFFGTLGIRFYFYLNGDFVLVHQVQNGSNNTFLAPVYINATLREEVFNSATASSSSTMLVYNANLMSEGADEVYPTYPFSVSNGATTVGFTARHPILSIQASTTGPSSIRNYGQISNILWQIYGSGAAIYYEIIINGTLTGASFSTAGTGSIANFDVAATSISGGTRVGAGLIASAGGAAGGAISIPNTLSLFPLVYSSLLNTQDVLTIVGTSLGAAVTASATLSWTESY